MNSTPVQRERRKSQKRFVAQPEKKSVWMDFTLVVLSMAVVMGIHNLIKPYWVGEPPLTGIVVPILVGSLLGLRPALLAMLLSLCVGALHIGVRWAEPIQASQIAQLSTILIFGLFIILISMKFRSFQEKLMTLKFQ